MPLRHRHGAFIPESMGIWFVLTDADQKDVLCVVDPKALRAAAKECGMASLSNDNIFRELRPAIEACASDKYDRGGVAADGAVHVWPADLLAA